jgi:hypothetical protein
MTVSYARDVTSMPLYQAEYYMEFANRPEVPILILVGTYDANTENGLGAWFQQGLGNNSHLLNVPYNSHVCFDFDAPCADSIILAFFQSLGESYDSSCLDDIEPPDFDGSTQEARNYSMQLFGTYDLWNNGFEVDVDAAVPTTSTTTVPLLGCIDNNTSKDGSTMETGSSPVSNFISLNALEPDQLVALIRDSIALTNEDSDIVHTKAVELVQKCLEILQRT